jgi:DNA-binding SARP family transcriptional activator/tetratricopeptide (TPR) repeat protein
MSLRLHTFGGLWLATDALPFGLAPRRLALLAIVAAAGRKGVSRDRVLGLLWPEAEPELARHTLSQTLYSLKRDTGREWVSGVVELRLDPDVSSDVGEFEEALEAGDLERAASLYAGRFLEGFYLPGVGEFERWAEERRAGLHNAAVRAGEQLATRSEQGGRIADAVRFWTRLTELEPLSARFAAGRMRALARAGDRASALAHARSHEQLIRRELDAEVDPSILELVRALKSSRTVPSSSPPQGDPHIDKAFALAPDPVTPATSRARRWSSRLTLAILTVLLAALVGLGLWNSADPATEVYLAVGSIETSGASSGGSVLRDMLATSLGGVAGIQILANSRLVELTPPGEANSPGSLGNAARRAGATELIEGELSGDSGRLVLSLRRVTLSTGVVRRGYTLHGPTRTAVIDSAAAAIARDFGLPAPTRALSEIRTVSAAAYALYDEGLRAWYRYDAPAAHRLMSAAVERDSGFGMAAYYAWRSASSDPNATRYFLLAQGLAPRLIERERLMVQADMGELATSLTVAAARAETLTVRYPTDPDGQVILSKIRFYQGNWAGSVAAANRAIALDSTASVEGPLCRICSAFGYLIDAYLWWDSAGAAERAARRLAAMIPTETRLAGRGIEPLLRNGKLAEAELTGEKSHSGVPASATYRASIHRDHIRWGRWETLDRELGLDLARPTEELRGDASWLLAISLRDRGRLQEGIALTRHGRFPPSQSLPDWSYFWIAEAMILLETDPRAAAELFQREARGMLSSDLHAGYQARNTTWLLALAGTALAAAGDTARVRMLADSIEVLGQGSTFGRDLILHFFLRGLLLQHAGRHAEAVDAFRRSLFSLTDGYTRTNLMLARSLLQLERPEEAIAVLQPAIRGGVDGSNTYVSRTELHEALADAFQAAGQPDSAKAHYRVVERNWRGADPRFQQRYARARAAAGLANLPQ